MTYVGVGNLGWLRCWRWHRIYANLARSMQFEVARREPRAVKRGSVKCLREF